MDYGLVRGADWSNGLGADGLIVHQVQELQRLRSNAHPSTLNPIAAALTTLSGRNPGQLSASAFRFFFSRAPAPSAPRTLSPKAPEADSPSIPLLSTLSTSASSGFEG
mmetsp:Transcript_13511/g.21116  ORF Transcript_13511/g.21116 Transcript_13511/m.21116 type:complete len:108 (-) Transcript_13511:386-709(-)